VAVLNAAAMKTDAEFGAQEGLTGPISGPRYYLHNDTFGLAGALMAGDRALALKYAEHAPVAFPVGSPSDRRATAVGRSYIAYGRFAPAKALAIAQAPTDNAYLQIMRHYARGEALAGQGDASGALAEAAAIRGTAGDNSLISIAAAVLEGRAAMAKNDPERAAKAFEGAATLQERVYATNFDPPPWWYPVRRSLAAAELKAGHAEAAAKDAEASLKIWPGDPLAMRVLSEANYRLGRKSEGQSYRAQADRAWRGNAKMPGMDLI
jgi:hypothetical protein